MKKRGLPRLFGIIAGALLAAATPVLAAPFAYVPSSFTNTVTVIDAATNTVVTGITVGNSPFGVAVDPVNPHVYVTNFADDTVSVLRTTSNTVVGTVPVEDGPFGVAVHRSGKRAYVANQMSNTVSVINTDPSDTGLFLTVVGTIAVGSRPAGVAVNQAGTRVYVTNQGSSSVSIIMTDPSSGEPPVMVTPLTVSVGLNPFGIAVAPDGTRVYVTNSGSGTMTVLDGAGGFIATVTVGSFPLGVAVHPSGSHVYTANNGSGTISVISAATIGTASPLVTTVPVVTGLFGIGVTPSGSHVYVASEDFNRVYVMATATNSVTGNVIASGGPAAFGMFFATPPPVCDTSELEAAYAAARESLTRCENDLAAANKRNTALTADNQALVAENERLRSSQGSSGSSSALAHALVGVLFGDRPNAEVTAAVRDATRVQLDAAARAAVPGDPRLRRAQGGFAEGLALATKGEWRRAVQEFREAYLLAELIRGEAFAQRRRDR